MSVFQFHLSPRYQVRIPETNWILSHRMQENNSNVSLTKLTMGKYNVTVCSDLKYVYCLKFACYLKTLK